MRTNGALGYSCVVLRGIMKQPLNIYYDNVFKVDVPDTVTKIGFVNDLVLVITAKTLREAKNTLNVAFLIVLS